MRYFVIGSAVLLLLVLVPACDSNPGAPTAPTITDSSEKREPSLTPVNKKKSKGFGANAIPIEDALR
jgi:hypothetical protein